MDDIQHYSFSLQLRPELECDRCKRTKTLCSHGFSYRESPDGNKVQVGKRLICHPHRRGGCGATVRLLLSKIVPRLHYGGHIVMAFLIALSNGGFIRQSYQKVTGAYTLRNSWRWAKKARARLAPWRTYLFHHQGSPQQSESDPESANDWSAQQPSGPNSTTALKETLRDLLMGIESEDQAEHMMANLQFSFQAPLL